MEKRKMSPTLGTIVTGAGVALIAMKMKPVILAGIVGFGLAHIVGSMDMVDHEGTH